MSDSQSFRRFSNLSAVAIRLDRGTVQALKYVRGRAVMPVQAREKVIPLTVSKAGFGSQSFQGGRAELFQFRVAHGSEECRGIVTAREPSFLLPCRKSRSPPRNLLLRLHRQFFFTDSVFVGKDSLKFLSRARVCDTPGTNLIVQFIARIHRTRVNETALLVAAEANLVGFRYTAARDGVGVVFK